MLLSIGNLYLENNYLGINTAGKTVLEIGKEYAAPKYEIRLGGSAVNFATQIKKFGFDTGILGKIGNDGTGLSILNLLKKENISTDLIVRSSKVKTNIDTGLVLSGNGKNIQIVAGTANQSLSVSDLRLSRLPVKKVSGVYFGGSFKQKLLWPKYPEIFRQISGYGIKIFLDPGRVPVDADDKWISVLEKILPFVDVYFPNEAEILQVTAKDNLKEALERAYSWGPKIIAVKLGEKGCLVKKDEDQISVPGFKVKAISTVGAGDVFNAAFIACRINGKTVREAGLFANAAAAVRVSYNYQPGISLVKNFLNNH